MCLRQHGSLMPPFPRRPAYAAVLAVKGLRFAPINALRAPLTAPGDRTESISTKRERGRTETQPLSASGSPLPLVAFPRVQVPRTRHSETKERTLLFLFLGLSEIGGDGPPVFFRSLGVSQILTSLRSRFLRGHASIVLPNIVLLSCFKLPLRQKGLRYPWLRGGRG